MIIEEQAIDAVRKAVQKIRKENPKEKIEVRANDEEFNRKVLEMGNIDLLLSPEFHGRKDKLKQRDSGLNEVLCHIAAKNNVKIGIEINRIQRLEKKEKAIILSRIIQNLMLCKKAGCQLKVLGDYDKKDAFSLLLTLGASTEQAKKAVE